MQRTAYENGFNGDRELDVTIFRDVEGPCEREVNGPAAIEDRNSLAALKQHRVIVL